MKIVTLTTCFMILHW